MDISKIIHTRSKLYYGSLVLLSALNGVLSVSLLAFINSKIAGTAFVFDIKYDWLVFICLITSTFVINKVFQTYMIDLASSLSNEFEREILQKIRFADLHAFDRIGSSRILTAIGDVRALGDLHEIVLNLINACVILIGCFVYLVYKSMLTGLGVFLVIAVLFSFYMLRNHQIEKDLQRKRGFENDLYRYLDDLLKGFKEIRSSFVKNATIHEVFFKRNRTNRTEIVRKTHVKYMTNELFGTFSWYLVVGFVLFVSSFLGLTSSTSFLVTILFIMGPLGLLVSLIPLVTTVKIAISRLREFENILRENSDSETHSNSSIGAKQQYAELVIEQLSFQYKDEKGKATFSFGPVDLRIDSGEIVFIHGGNGSGKSTFINLLTGLYRNHSGKILLNGKEVKSDNYEFYSRHLSVVFSTPHLLSEYYENLDFESQQERLAYFTTMFEMDHIINIRDPASILKQNFSKGQLKRVALILALLEEKPLLVLDEWASEQDPEFRNYFYTKVIPYLKSLGKTLIVVTHDDSYFCCADRLIRFHDGRITSDRLSTEP